MTTLEERVDRGVLFLDKTVDKWRERINLDTLDLSDPGICVLGQVFDSQFGTSAWRRGELAVAEFEYDHELLDDENLDYAHVAYGFERQDRSESYEDLQAVWVQRILHG